jgi:N-acetyllactosaminide beta-1,3-N-acetylglucosaminyltransferase
VLDEAFLIHLGYKTQEGFHHNKDLEQEQNRLLFRKFKEELKTKYPESPRRCY